MSSDLTKVEEWAQIFTKPKTLIETVGKNGALHILGLKKDFASVKSNWSTQNYFNAGLDVADALTKLIGPVPASPSFLQ